MASKDKKLPEKRDDSSKSEILHRLKTRPFLFIGTVIVLVIVIIAFVFVPAIVPSAQRGQTLTFGYYNKVPISYVRDSYFYQVLSSISRERQPSSDDPNYIWALYQMWRQAYEETAVHIGIMDEMKQAGYIAPEKVVDREVAKLPMFNVNGKFSSAAYQSMEKTTRMNLWKQVQDSMVVTMYMSDLSDLKTSSNDASFISSMASPQRTFDLVSFSFSSYPDSEIISYAEANPNLFKVVHLSIITIYSSEREARQVLNAVKNGTSTFEEAAMTSSMDNYADRGGDMGIRMAHELMYDIGDEQTRANIINLARGELSDIIKVSTGWAFFRAEETGYTADTNDPAQLDKIRNYIMIYSRGQVEDWFIAEAEKFSSQAREMGFDEAAAAGSLTKQNFGPIPLNYGNTALFSSISSAGVPELANAGTNQFFWRAAFSTPLNSLSIPIVVGENVIVLLPLEESDAEENNIQFIEMYYPYWVNAGLEQSYRSYFLNNEKLDDRFGETFWKIWGNQ